ncbi:MAG: OmpP1/FadL family transporter [Saprospiraceae bacterium]
MRNRIIGIIPFLAIAATAGVLLALPVQTTAQNVADALRYAQWSYGGTARFVGAGGTMSAIGADLSLSSINPAGIGWYQKSEFTFTPGVLNTTINARMLDATNSPGLESLRGAFNIQNMGMVFVSQPQNAGKWRGSNFAITFNHLANFNGEFAFEGITLGSITQRYQELANSGLGLDDYETDLANQASALYDFDEDGRYDIDYEIPRQAPLLFKSQTGSLRGSMSEISFTLAANYDDVIIIGASVGLPVVYFSQDKTYIEQDDPKIANGGAIPYFRDLELREQLNTFGGGVNAKLGLIIRPSQFLRIGASVHSPSVLSLSDDYESSLTYNYYEDANEKGTFLGKTANSPGRFEYLLNTPWRATGGIGVLFGKNGFLSADAEFVDFGKSRFRYDGFSSAEQSVNSGIQNQLADVLNLRIGGEYAYDIFRFRAGINRLPSPFQGENNARYILSAGAGFRLKGFFMDLAFRNSRIEERYYPYLTDNAPVQEVLNKSSQGALLCTLGVKF